MFSLLWRAARFSAKPPSFMCERNPANICNHFIRGFFVPTWLLTLSLRNHCVYRWGKKLWQSSTMKCVEKCDRYDVDESLKSWNIFANYIFIKRRSVGGWKPSSFHVCVSPFRSLLCLWTPCHVAALGWIADKRAQRSGGRPRVEKRTISSVREKQKNIKAWTQHEN